MANKRLIQFPVNALPTGDDIIYFGDQSDAFRETRTTLDQERAYTPQYVRFSDENVTQLFMGKNVINGSASPITFTIPLGAPFPITSQFNMIRNGTGAFTLTAAAGVTLNGVDGGSVTLPQQFDRLVATEILTNEWTYIEYSGGVGASTLQDAYDNGIDGNINLTVGKPFTQSSTVAGARLPSMTETEFEAIATPLNGEWSWDEINDKVIVNKGSAGSPIYDHLAYDSELPPPVLPAFGEMFFQGNAAETTITAQSTPVRIAGTYVAGESQDFTHVAGTLTYTGTEARVFSVNVSTTTSLNLNTANITVLIAKNGIVIAQSGQSPDLDGVSPSFVPMSLNKLVSLSTNDTIEVWTQNNSVNNENITHQDLNVSVGTPGIPGGSLTGSGIPGLSIFSHVGFSATPLISTRFHQKIGKIVSINFRIANIQKMIGGGQNVIEVDVPFSPSFTSTVQAEGNGTIGLFNSLLPGDTSRVSNISSLSGQSRIRIDFFIEKEGPPNTYKSSFTLSYQIQ